MGRHRPGAIMPRGWHSVNASDRQDSVIACAHNDGKHTMFCGLCGKVRDRGALRRVRLMGFTGGQSTNPKVEEFFATGDPSVFAKPGALDYRGD
jgi:hypothetical protein